MNGVQAATDTFVVHGVRATMKRTARFIVRGRAQVADLVDTMLENDNIVSVTVEKAF